MSKFTCSLFAALTVVCVGFSSPAHADSPSTVRANLAALYHKEDVAADHKDSFGALSCYDPNVQIFDKNGNQSGYNDQLEALDTSFKVAKSIHLQTSIIKFSMKGNDAVVVTKQVLDTVIMFPGGKKTIRIIGTTISRHLWSKGMDDWTIQQARILSRAFKIRK